MTTGQPPAQLGDGKDSQTSWAIGQGAAANPPTSPQARFLSTMSHELRTPLNVVIGFSEAMMRDGGATLTREQVVEYASSINESGRQLLTLVDVILDVARVEAGHFDLPADLIEIGHLVGSAVSHANAAAQAGSIILVGEAQPDLPLLRGDERRLRQTLGHLLGNAIKFTPFGGVVRLAARVEARSGDLLLLVSDTGIGIAEEDLDRVFEPFVQLDGSHSRRFPGSGLGLYVSRITARAHGGELILSSQPGVGTTAVLRLPAERLVALPAELFP